jgi:putative restriction endonuclease
LRRTVTDQDQRVRLAAFDFLDRQRQLHGETLRREVLLAGFDFEGRRVPLLGPPGIFKPALCELPLSITTVPPSDRKPRPYDDAMDPSTGLLRYRYRGDDAIHPDNAGLREARRRQAPLIYFFGLMPSRYVASWPVFIVGDNPASLTFTVAVDDRQLTATAVPADSPEVEIRRRYVTRLVRQRLHQQAFRERVLAAYREHCAICRLRHQELLEAAHIVGDANPEGEPRVSNGLALCKLHHAAFDAHILGVRPDYIVEVRLDVLEEIDGPMLKHGLQGFHGQPLLVPTREAFKPSRESLEQRYAVFRNHGVA